MQTTSAAPRALLIDVDGTLCAGDAPLPGAVEAVRRLVALGVPHRFLTNTTRFSRDELARRLGTMGFPVSPDALFTAPRAAAAWLRRSGIRRALLYVPESVRADFAGIEASAERPAAVVVGDLGPEWSFDLMNQAFRALHGGARLVALQRNRWWLTAAGPALDAGAFVAALEYAAATTAVVVGKPAREFFLLAGASLGVEPARITVVGDDLAGDVAGARGAGMRSALVRTGKFRAVDLAGAAVAPDEVGDDLGTLVRRWFDGPPPAPGG